MSGIKKMLRDNVSGTTAVVEGQSCERSLNLSGKKAVVFGVATDQSLAWKIAKTLNDNGCQVALAYQGRLDKYVQELAKQLNQPVLGQCDVSSDEDLASFFSLVREQMGAFDYLIHSVAFAKRSFLQGKFYEVDRKNFSLAQEISAFSLAAVVKASQDLLRDNGRVLTMTYIGSVRAMPSYNIMGVCKAALEASVRYLAADLGDRGITVNAISAGPVKTLAASAISGFDTILRVIEERSPLKRNISSEDVGNLALFLCSDLARNITGQVLYVDAGYNIVGI